MKGSDCEIEIQRGMTETDLMSSMKGGGGNRPPPPSSKPRTAQNLPQGGAPATTTNPGMPVLRESKAATPVTLVSRVKNSSTTTNPTVVASSSTPSSQPPTDWAIIPYDQLVDGMIGGIDPAHKERYLSEEEFGRIFGMARDQFERLPAWKRTALKKQHGLF